MHRQWLLNKLNAYTQQIELKEQYIDFIKKNPDCFSRKNTQGHITGSAWVLNKDNSKVALIFHKKLQKWMQPGGHSDEDPRTDQVALKEAFEETGLKDLKLVFDGIFDLDIHNIPERSGEPSHLHYDVRFLLQAQNEKLILTDEVGDLRWFDFAELQTMNLEESVLRMVRKWKEFI